MPTASHTPAQQRLTTPMTARLSRHTGLLLVSNGAGALLLFALSVAIGRVSGREGLAVYSAVLAWVFPLSLAVDFGLSTLATREVAQAPASARQQLALMSWARLALGGTGALLILLAAPLFSDNPDVVHGLRLSAPLLIVLPLYSSFTAIFKGMGAMWPIPWLNIGMLVAQVVLSLLVLAHGGDIQMLLVVNLVTSLGQLLAAWVLWQQFFSPRVSTTASHAFDYAHITAALRRAWPFALAAVFAALQMRVSLILLERSASVDEVAYFAAASRFVEAGRLIPNAFFGALFPALAALAANPHHMKQTFRRAASFLMLFGLAGVIAATLLSLPLIELTYGASFSPAAPVLQVLTVALLFSLLRGAYTLLLYARQAESRVNRVNGWILILQVILSLWLIGANGAFGAALALVATEAVAFIWLSREQRTLAPAASNAAV